MGVVVRRKCNLEKYKYMNFIFTLYKVQNIKAQLLILYAKLILFKTMRWEGVGGAAGQMKQLQLFYLYWYMKC